jgi:hypothetical protein
MANKHPAQHLEGKPPLRPPVSPELVAEIRAAMKAYINDLPRRPPNMASLKSTSDTTFVRKFKTVYRSKGKGRGKRTKLSQY